MSAGPVRGRRNSGAAVRPPLIVFDAMRTRQRFLRRCGVQASVPDRCAGRDFCARGEPLVVALELQSELVIEDLQVAVAAAHDRLRHDRQNFLRHHADVGRVAAIVVEAIEAENVVEVAKERDVVLEHHIGSPATAGAAAPAATNAAAPAATNAAATNTAAAATDTANAAHATNAADAADTADTANSADTS